MKRLLTFALFALIAAFAAPAARATDTTTVTVNGSGTVADNQGPTISCVGTNSVDSGTCTTSYASFSGTITMTATPAAGWAFGSWTNSGNPVCTASGNTCSFSSNQTGGHTVTIVANFVAAPSVTKSFNPTSIPATTGTSTLLLTVSNTNAATMSGVGLVDTFPSTNLKLSGTTISTCGGTLTAVSGASSITLAGGSITANSSCTITATVTSTVAASYVNTTNAPTSTADGTGTAASATLIVYGTATKLVYGVSPSSAAAGVAITPAITVQVEDANSNVVANSTVAVGMAIGTNPNGGTLSGTASVNAVNGVATFSTLSINKTGTAYTLVASSGILTSATSAGFNITPGTATQLVLTTPPSTPDNGGSAFGTQPVVSVEDSFGNIVTSGTNSNASITLAIGTNPVGGALSCTSANPLTATAGVATFVGCSINKAAVGYTLIASASGLSSANSGSITIQVGPAAKLAFGVSPSNAQAGVAISPAVTVQILDAGGNLTTSTASVSLAITTNPGSGTLTGGGANPAVSGTATFSALSINKTGNGYILTASSGVLTTIASGTFNITPGTATQLVWGTQPPASVASGASITPPVTVQVEDANNNVVTTGVGSTASIAMAIGNNPSSGTLSGTTPVNAVAGVATFSGLSINLVGTAYTLSAASSGLATATSNGFNITPGAANKLAFNVQPSSAVDTVAISPAITVQILDAAGNLTTSTTSVTLAITTNPGGSTLTGGGATAAVSGTATFGGVSLNKVGNGYILTATDGALTAATSNPFNITIGTATKLVFSQGPSNAQAGVAISPAITVLIEDAGSNVTASTASVAMAIGTNPGTSTLSGTTPQPGVNGTATFGDLSLNKVGTAYTLVASSSGLTSATSGTFNITPGTATQVVFTQQPGGGTGGTAWVTASQPKVSVEDANNNVVTTATNSITLAIGTNAGPGGTLTCTTNPQNAAAGVDTFAGCKIDVAGAGYTLTAAASGLTGATSNPFSITVGAAAKLQIGVQPSNAQDTVAISPAVTVQILDAGGNLTTSTASVTFAIGVNAGPGGVLTGGTATPAVSGTATFSNLSINKIGTGYTLIASSGALTAATTSPFNITLGPATQLTFTTEPANTNNHTTMPNVVVQIQDAGGNLVSSASAAVTLAISNNAGPGGTLSGTLTQNTVSGAATFNDLSIDKVGTAYTLNATSSPVFTSEISTSFNITAGPASQLVFTTQPSTTAAPGAAFAIQPSVSVEDPFGNVVTSSTASITLAIGNNAGPGGVLTCTATTKNATAGVDTFAACSINKNGNGYTLTATSSGLTTATSNSINITSGATRPVTQQVTGSCQTNSGSTCTINLNLTGVTSGNNVLLVDISSAATSVANEEVASGVTWNGTAMTLVPSCTITEGPTGDNTAHTEIWSLSNPTLANNSVVVTFPATHAQTIYAGATLFSNVGSIGTCQTTTGLVTNPGTVSKNFTVQVGGAAFDAVAVNSSGGSAITVGAGQSTNYNAASSPSAGAGSVEFATSTTVTMSYTWTNGSSSLWAYAGVPINPVIVHKGQVIVGSLFPEQKPQPDIFHLGDSSRFQSTSPSSTTNPPSPSTDRDANPSAIISKRDD